MPGYSRRVAYPSAESDPLEVSEAQSVPDGTCYRRP